MICGRASKREPLNPLNLAKIPGGGGVLLGIRGGGVPRGSPNPDPISDQTNVIFHTRFKNRTLKSIPVFRPSL